MRHRDTKCRPGIEKEKYRKVFQSQPHVYRRSTEAKVIKINGVWITIDPEHVFDPNFEWDALKGATCCNHT